MLLFLESGENTTMTAIANGGELSLKNDENQADAHIRKVKLVF